MLSALISLFLSLEALGIPERTQNIGIVCHGENNSLLTVDMSLTDSFAVLYYEKDMTPMLNITIEPPHGIYSSSSVSFNTSSSHGEKVFTIQGSFSIIHRVTRFAQFTLTLQQKKRDPTLFATDVEYAYGIDIDEESRKEGSFLFDNLVCEISGH
jgi:hypothetical protein